MPPNYLPLSVKNVGIDLEKILTAMGDSFEYKMLYFDRISSLYRQLGIGEYLMSDDAQLMHAKLQLGVQSYIEYLKNAPEEEKACSRCMVFFDAICLGDSEAIGTIAKLAPRAINSRKEYEEDFFYMRILMDMLGLNKTFEDVEDLLKEYESFASESNDERYVLLEALKEKDLIAFESSLEVVIEEHERKYEDGGDLYAGTQDEATIMSGVSIEVMALVHILNKAGITVHNEYSLAPSSALVSSINPKPSANAWRQARAFRSFKK